MAAADADVDAAAVDPSVAAAVNDAVPAVKPAVALAAALAVVPAVADVDAVSERQRDMHYPSTYRMLRLRRWTQETCSPAARRQARREETGFCFR